MNIGSLKITAKQGARTSDIPRLLQSATCGQKTEKSEPNGIIKSEKRAGLRVSARFIVTVSPSSLAQLLQGNLTTQAETSKALSGCIETFNSTHKKGNTEDVMQLDEIYFSLK